MKAAKPKYCVYCGQSVDTVTAQILEKLEELSKTQHLKQSPWMNTAEAAKYLRCSSSQVDKLTFAGLLPFRRLDPNKPKSQRIFHRKQLDSYLIIGRNPTVQRLSPAEKRQVEELCS